MTSSRQARQDSRGTPTASGEPRGTGRRISPGVVILAIALIGSVVYTVFVLTVRDASQIPLLVSGLVILAIVFIALAAYCARAIWRASLAGRDGRAFALALAGGLAAIAGAGCVAGAIILILLRQTAG
jgi:hypothetical protein